MLLVSKLELGGDLAQGLLRQMLTGYGERRSIHAVFMSLNENHGRYFSTLKHACESCFPQKRVLQYAHFLEQVRSGPILQKYEMGPDLTWFS